MEEERTDEDLMLAYRDGDTMAFETLYLRSRAALYRWLLRQLGRPELAMELFRDIWLRVIRAHQRYSPQARFRTYLYHLAHHVLIDHYRHRAEGFPPSYDQEMPVSAEPSSDADLPAASRRQAERLLQLVGRLPEAPREVFLLREETQLGMEEIARVTDVKPEVARTRLHAALQFLRQGMRVAE